jgi:hypothetical protein
MTRIHTTLLGGMLAALALAVPASAHHGTNVSYDHDKPVVMTGTVTEFVWKNPHVQLYFEAKDANGVTQQWASELNSPSVLSRQGWTRMHFKPGDALTITLFPSKSGTTVGVVDRTKPILVAGKVVVAPLTRNVD